MRDEFVALLLSQVGQHEGRDPDGTWNNEQRYSKETPGLEWSDGQPWCATFQCWGAHRTPGMEPLWPMTASCLTAVAWWRQRGRWSNYPVLGGPFYLGPGGGTHTGVVVAYDATTITTVEGNSNSGGSPEGDGVYRRTRARSSIYGYGVPAYPEGTISADPKLGGTPTAHVNTPNTALQEDEVTPADLQAIGSAVANAAIPRYDQSGKHIGDAPMYLLIAGFDLGFQRLDRTLAAQGAILKTLLDQAPGVDTQAILDAMDKAVGGAVRDALASDVVHVQVDVNGNTTAPKGA
ncbi:CHAP domain-containing protein [Kitasatospora cineracea]